MREKVYALADKLENKGFHVSDVWFLKLKIIHETVCKKLCKKSVPVSEETIKERKNENSIIFQDHEEKYTFNVHEKKICRLINI